jgi:hypothetical protein
MTPDFENHFLSVCKRPSMFATSGSFDAVCAYLDGFDAARDGGPLLGFQPWMVIRQGSGTNLTWVGLVLHEALGERGYGREPLEADESRHCIETLGRLLTEFFEDRRSRYLVGFFDDYAKWLRKRKVCEWMFQRRGKPLKWDQPAAPQAPKRSATRKRPRRGPA